MAWLVRSSKNEKLEEEIAAIRKLLEHEQKEKASLEEQLNERKRRGEKKDGNRGGETKRGGMKER